MFNIVLSCYYDMKTKNMYNKVKEIGRKYALPLMIAGSLSLGSCAKKYGYDNITIKYGNFSGEYLEEKRNNGTKISYHLDGRKKIHKIKIKTHDGTFRYSESDPKDSSIIQTGEARVEYLFHKIDSIEKAERENSIKEIKNLERKLE